MSKGLEALGKLKNDLVPKDPYEPYEGYYEIIEAELKAFSIMAHAFIKDKEEREELLKMTEEDFLDAYKHETGDMKDMFTEEEYVFVLKVLQGVLA